MARSPRIGLGAALALLLAGPATGQEVVRVTVGHGGAQPDGRHGVGVISGDGRFVAFVSQATNLIAGDTNGAADVFVRQLATATTTLVSLAADGQQRAGHSGAVDRGGAVDLTTQEHDINHDGRYVVFTSRAALVAGDTFECAVPPDVTPANCPDIYLRDRQTNETVRISVAAGGGNPNGPSFHPRISGDGRLIVFESTASNLVDEDSNGQSDIFLVNRQHGTLTRVSVGPGGTEVDGASVAPSISDDVPLIGFLSNAIQLVADPDPIACQPVPGATGIAPCFRPFVVSGNGPVRRVPMPAIATSGVLPGSTPVAYTVRVEARTVIPAFDGRSVAVGARTISTLRRHGVPITEDRGWVYDDDEKRITFDQLHVTPTDVLYRNIAYQTYVQGPQGTASDAGGLGIFDPRPKLHETIPGGSTVSSLMGNMGRFGGVVSYRTAVAVTGDDTDAEADVYVYDRDPDRDGMPTFWENLFGLNPANSFDGMFDPDGDSFTNLMEYTGGSHPNPSNARYLAEGASNGYFSTRIDIANPGPSTAHAVVQFLGDDGRSTNATWLIPAGEQRTVAPDGMTTASFSTLVESDAHVAVDRTMTWAGGHGSHAESAVPAASTTWFLAEGATHGRFSLFYLLQNPARSQLAIVDITFLRPAPAAPITRQYHVRPTSRMTILVDGIPELAATDVSARITSDLPIFVERAMYLDTLTPPRVFGAGHAGAAVPAANTRWFLAEGATGPFFDLFYLVANPFAQATTARISYLRPTGDPIVRDYPVPARSRVTIPVASQDPLLANTPVSAVVESTSSVGLVVERSMWWPGQGQWTEGHLSAGSTVSAPRWALAGCAVDAATDTFVLIANTTATAGTVTLRTLPVAGSVPPFVTTVAVPANSRVSVPMRQYEAEPAIGGQAFGLLLESDGPAIVVERAVYTTVDGVIWSAGTAALGTPLP